MGNEKVVIVKTWKEHQQDETLWIALKFLALVFVGMLIFILLASLGFSYKTSKIITLVIIPLAIVLFLFRKEIFKKREKHSSPHHHKEKSRSKGFVKDYLIWFIAFTIGIIVSYFIRKIYVPDMKIIWFVVLSGFIIEVCSKIMQILVLNHKWIVDKRFLFWVIVQCCLFFLSFYLIEKIITMEFILFLVGDITTYFIWGLVLIGIVQTILVHIVWRLNIEGKIFR